LKQFIIKLLTFSFLGFILLELFARVFLDPQYFKDINTYLEKRPDKSKIETDHVDFLFIGSSRVPAAVDAHVFGQLNQNKIVINAGRGYLTSGIHYQAILNNLASYPEFLTGSIVLLEYPGSSIYTEGFLANRYVVNESMSHLVLPHLDKKAWLNFIKKSNNSIDVKIRLTCSFLSAAYRTYAYVNEKYFKKRIYFKTSDQVADEGGIRNDKIDAAKKLAISVAERSKQSLQTSPLFTKEYLDQSILAKLSEAINDHGGRLLLFEMPLHSVQAEVHSSSLAKKNKVIFEEWLQERKISVVRTSSFSYKDSDFPDMWHLSIKRRDEFTENLHHELLKLLSK
jgi:hypothetical protein